MRAVQPSSQCCVRSPLPSPSSPPPQANINQCGGSRLRTALHYATAYHRRGVVEVLLNHGADLAVLDADGNTPMNLCTDADILHLMSKEVSSTSALVCVCVRACVCYFQTGHTRSLSCLPQVMPTLCAVVRSGDLDAAARLLASHTEEGVGQGEGFIEQRDALFYTPLHIACQRGQL